MSFFYCNFAADLTNRLMPMEEKKTTQRDLTHLKIIIAAQRLFSEKGRDKVNMQMVADECGMCRRTVYNHFRTMDELFKATIEYELDKMIDNLGKILQQKVPADEMLRRFVHTHFAGIRQAVEHNKALKVSFYESYADIDRARKPIDLKEIRMIKDIIDKGRMQGVFDIRESHLPAMLLLYAIKGIELPYVNHTIGNILDSNHDYIMNILFNGIKRRRE